MAALARAQSVHEPCKHVVYFLFMVNYRVVVEVISGETDCRVPPTQQRRKLICLRCGTFETLDLLREGFCPFLLNRSVF